MNGWGYPPQAIKRSPKRRKARYHSPHYAPQGITYRDVERMARLAGKTVKESYVVSKKAYAVTRPIAIVAGRKAFAFAKWGAGKVKERYRPSYEPAKMPRGFYKKTEEKKGFFSRVFGR